MLLLFGLLDLVSKIKWSLHPNQTPSGDNETTTLNGYKSHPYSHQTTLTQALFAHIIPIKFHED
jgi:hypothetical protein